MPWRFVNLESGRNVGFETRQVIRRVSVLT
ncbi:hypothetical protein H4W29_003731 [Rhizobium viscosum]|uniref:Uncharacterized protein n=1 Tax=Rhizobium viscosum TaxID=1673 RepID=A0ABR9ITM4_RHIVS|nr:hypothetical protein [Rhizobium viscosum]